MNHYNGIMENYDLASSYFFMSRSIIAEAFRDIDWIDTDWGHVFSWKNFSGFDANFAYYTLKSIDKKYINEIITWLKDGENRKLISKFNLDFTYAGLEIINDLIILLRGIKKVDFPLLKEFSIRKYSYLKKDLSLNILRFVSLIGELLDVPKDQERNINRFAQAILHLHNGIIWTLEDDDSNVYSVALTSEMDQITVDELSILSIEFLITNKKLRNNGYASLLLEHILAANHNKKMIVRTNESNQAIFRKYDFNGICSFNIWK